MSVFDFFRKKQKIRDTFYDLPLKDGGCGPKLFVPHSLRYLFSTPAQAASPASVFVLKSTSISQSKFVLAVFGRPFAYLVLGHATQRDFRQQLGNRHLPLRHLWGRKCIRNGCDLVKAFADQNFDVLYNLGRSNLSFKKTSFEGDFLLKSYGSARNFTKNFYK